MSSTQNPLYAHALATLELADLALARAPMLAIDEPHRAEDITTDSLTAMLAGANPDAKLERMELADAHDGMTQRNCWHLIWNQAGQQANLPQQIFVKSTPENPYLRETLSLLHMAEHEVRFYNQIQPELDVIAPQAYYARSYPGGRFLLLMEVLEARGLKPYWQGYDCSLEHARAVLDALATLHATYWNSPRFDTDLVWVRPRTQRFGFEWHQKSFNIARQKFLEMDIVAQLPAEFIELVRFWDANDRAVYAYWDTLPQTLLHGDSHLGNTFAYPDGKAGFFDWQVIYRGHGLRDVAYFLLNSLENNVRQEYERTLVDEYLAALKARGIDLDADSAWKHYCLFALDALDANIKTTTRGGYGHATNALQRGLQCAVGSIMENETASLVQQVVRHGSL